MKAQVQPYRLGLQGRKTHGKASARSLTGAEAAEKAADKAEKSSNVPGRQVVSDF
jgi:hypothetical protein